MKEYLLKDKEYFSDIREDMVAFVPSNTKKMLDIGCGQGLFGKLCKEKLNCEVHGIELVEPMGNIAKQYLDKVLIGDARDNLMLLKDEKYDLITMNDVIEHIINPEDFINLLTKYLKPNGKILFSIPNFRYIYNLIEIIIKKDFEYKDSGTLDKTHLTFFTIKSFTNTLNRLGFEIVRSEGLDKGPMSSKLKLLKPFFKFISQNDIFYYQLAFLVKLKSI